jgi:4-hydroxybenzoate polyprenyltransferase
MKTTFTKTAAFLLLLFALVVVWDYLSHRPGWYAWGLPVGLTYLAYRCWTWGARRGKLLSERMPSRQ